MEARCPSTSICINYIAARERYLAVRESIAPDQTRPSRLRRAYNGKTRDPFQLAALDTRYGETEAAATDVPALEERCGACALKGVKYLIGTNPAREGLEPLSEDIE